MAHWSFEGRSAGPLATIRKMFADMDLLGFLPLILIMGAFLFFSSRRQRKAMQATIDLHDSLRVGDRVYTQSGLEATIAAIADDTVDLEIAPGVVTRWMKLAIRNRIEADVPELGAGTDPGDAVSQATELSQADPDRQRKD